MENFQVTNQFSINYRSVIIDEIALNGLEGVGLDFLWKRVESRISSQLTEKMKCRYWNFIVNSACLTFYEAPDPIPIIEIVDRFQIVDNKTGHLKDSCDYIDGPYEYFQVPEEHGSCKNYDQRKKINSDSIKKFTYNEVFENYGQKLVIVASIEERWRALAPHMPITTMHQLNDLQYCILELIGRGRENGQMTNGKSNLCKIIKDPKSIFYQRKILEDWNLVKGIYVHLVTDVKGGKVLLLRLARFHQPYIMSLPKTGWQRQVIDHLLTKPGFQDKKDTLLQQGLMTQYHVKRFQKTDNFLKFEHKNVAKGSTKKSDKYCVSLITQSEESSESEEEKTIECRYKVHIPLVEQAKDLFIEAGFKGLSLVELAQLLGIEFYASRGICKYFINKKIIMEFMDSGGKHKSVRYVATSLSTHDHETEFDAEKKKYLDYMEDVKSKEAQDVQEDEPPKKKIKVEKISGVHNSASVPLDDAVTEIKLLEGIKGEPESFLNAKKPPTLKQFKYANGILQVLRERKVMIGYQPLSRIVAKQIGELPMDSKGLKAFLQKLIVDKQLKVYRVKWPIDELKYTLLVCSPHVKINDKIINDKYKEICIRTHSNSRSKQEIKYEPVEKNKPCLARVTYPRYMKIKLLHEFYTKFAYFDRDGEETDGIISLIDVVSNITVEFALGNLASHHSSQIPTDSITAEVLKTKLRDAPQGVFQSLLNSQKLINMLKFNTKCLASFGLIQLLEPVSSNKVDYGADIQKYRFYVNRYARILNTTGSWPREVSNVLQLEKSYFFATFDDVQKYWQDVYWISTNTEVNVPGRNSGKDRVPNAPLRLEADVKQHDNGQIFGDGKGPCGFHSAFFLDLAKLWRTIFTDPLKMQPIIKKKAEIKHLKPAQRKRKMKPLIPRTVKKERVLKEVRINEHGKKARNKVTWTVYWTKSEDHILVLCKAAVTVMSVVQFVGCLQIRNKVAKEILAMADPTKTANACHRRLLAIEKEAVFNYEKECIITELRRRKNILNKYEGLLKKLRKTHAKQMRDFMLEAKLRVLELVYIMLKITSSPDYAKVRPCVATDLTDFHNKYNLTASSQNELNTYKTNTDLDPTIATLKEAILLCTMLSYGETLTSEMQDWIYSIMKQYKEPELRRALSDIRNSKAISAKEKNMSNALNKLQPQESIQLSFKISVPYQKKWMDGRLNSNFVDDLAVDLISKVPNDDLKGSQNLNCLIFEMHSCGALELFFKTSPEVIAPDILFGDDLNILELQKAKLKPGTIGYKKKVDVLFFSELFKDVDIEKHLENIVRNAVVIREVADDVQDPVLTKLKQARDNGCTLEELQEATGLNTKILTEKLSELSSRNILRRVGYFENRVVLTEFIHKWSLNLGNEKFLIPTPWMRHDCTLKRDIFIKWTAAILNKVTLNPGYTVQNVANNYELISYRATQEICMFLERCGIVILSNVTDATPGIFNDDLQEPEISDFNEYAQPACIVVSPLRDSLTRFAYVRKKILEKD